MSHQKREHMNNNSANLEQRSALFSVGQQCADFNPTNLERRNHFDSFTANFEQNTHSHDFPDGLEQRKHVNSFYDNPEQSTHLNSSSSSCCQPLKHHGRHGEPLYKSLLRPHHGSYMDYVEGPHHSHQHECTFEAEHSAVGNCNPNQFTDCTTCRFGFPALPENHTSMGSVSKGQNYCSFRALSTNEITLYNWYLIRCSGSHPSEIAVGGFLSSRVMDNERIETSTIVKRLEECKVLTKDGNVVNLVGPIDDYRTVSNGFSLQTVHLFSLGFPHIWNLVVGMGLPAKGAGTNTVFRSRDFYGGEVTSQVILQKDFQFQGTCMHQFSVPDGRENERVSCLEAERQEGLKLATKESQSVEAVAKFPESVVLQEQANTSLDGKPQSSTDQPPLVQGLHEQQDKCKSLVRTESDKETELAMDFVKERSQHEASHVQMECTAKQLVEVMGPACEPENTLVGSVEAVVAESRSEDRKPGSVTKVSIEDCTQEKQDNKVFVESRTDDNQPIDLYENAGTVQIPAVTLEITSVQSPEISYCHRESRIAKRSKCSQSSLLRKRKVVFNIPNVMETEHSSSTSLTPATSSKSLGSSYSLNRKGAEPVSSMKSVDTENFMVRQTVTAKQKGKRKKKGRFLLPKYKRSTKPTVKDDICENMEDGKGEQEVHEEGLEEGCKKRKRMARIKNSTDEQSGAILSLEQLAAADKTSKGVASAPASVLEPIRNRRVETRQVVNEKSCMKLAAPKENIAKKGRGFLAKLQHTLKQTRVYDDDPSQMQNNDAVISMIDTQKVETENQDILKADNRRRKRGEADFDIPLGTSKRRKEKHLKTIETDDVEDSTCGQEMPEGYCTKQAPVECDSGTSTMASARKRLKQILPPPLPLPLVSVSKKLVSKAFGLKTSRSGRLLVPPLAHWRGQSLVRDMDGGIIAIEDGSQDATREDTGCFNFKPPIEARAKKLQKWLCETATESLTKKLKARKRVSSHKQRSITESQS